MWVNFGLYMLTDNSSGKQKWFMSSHDFVSDTNKNVEGKLAEDYQWLCMKVSTPMAVGYRLKLDVTQFLSGDQANYFQNLIGGICWAVELVQIGIDV